MKYQRTTLNQLPKFYPIEQANNGAAPERHKLLVKFQGLSAPGERDRYPHPLSFRA